MPSTQSVPNPRLVDEIASAVRGAEVGSQKMAMFHFQILKNAEELKDVNPEAFCKLAGVPATYKTEFRKMLALARVIRQSGVRMV